MCACVTLRSSTMKSKFQAQTSNYGLLKISVFMVTFISRIFNFQEYYMYMQRMQRKYSDIYGMDHRGFKGHGPSRMCGLYNSLCEVSSSHQLSRCVCRTTTQRTTERRDNLLAC